MKRDCGKLFLDWPEAFQAGTGKVGGKGWNLGRLERYGFNVPGGRVLSAGAYVDFIKENNLEETARALSRRITTDNAGEKEVDEELARFRERIIAGSVPGHVQEELVADLECAGLLIKPVAVRSSAAAEDSGKASFAGIHQSFLNIRGPENILTAVKGCYASLWTPRAVAYRGKMQIRDEEAAMAVVIMEMVEAKASGVAFTCDPRTGREDVVLINANYGLGESVVSGAVDPDEYRLDLKASIIAKGIGRKEEITVALKEGGTKLVKSGEGTAGQALPDEKISELGLLAIRVYEALGRGQEHQDIEWAFDGSGFFLVQARPVTALPLYTCPEIRHQPQIWSNANLRDAIPMVMSTLNWSISKISLIHIINVPFKMTGYKIPQGLQFIKLFQGRVYLNLSLQQWLWYDSVGMTAQETKASLGGHQSDIKTGAKRHEIIKGHVRKVRKLKGFLGLARVKGRIKKSFNLISEVAAALLEQDYGAMQDQELISVLSEIEKERARFAPVFSGTMGMASQYFMMLVKSLERSFPGKGSAMANALMAGSADITSARHGYRLWEMADIAREDADAQRYFFLEPFDALLWEKELPDYSPFKQAFICFLADYGHRGVYEGDIINPRWREDPTYLLDIIRSAIKTAGSGEIKARPKDKTAHALEQIRKLPYRRRLVVQKWLKQSLRGAELREMSKSLAVKLQEPLRMVFQEIGRRLAGRGIVEKQSDIYHCTLTEIKSILQGNWDGKGLAALVSERKAKRKEWEALSPPDVIVGDVPGYAEPVAVATGNALTGLGVAAGRASGPARLIYHPHEGVRLQDGDVLAAPSTDPAWTPLFLKASAVVMETGGFLSHGAIVAREYGVPAVVNIPGVLKIINDGKEITVDGDEGKIYL